MIIPRFFVDTSVIGGCYDAEFEYVSRQLFKRFERGLAVAVVSSVTMQELEFAPENVQNALASLPESSVEFVELDEEAAELADAYLSDGVVGLGSLADAQQVAIATLNRVDVIVSWNFKHIVNLGRIRLFSATNLRFGLATPEIRSPMEVLDEEEV